MKDYILKEYGSWAVFLIAFVTGIVVSKDFTIYTLYMLIALGMLVNSKQAFMLLLRKRNRKAFFAFFLQVISGIFLIYLFFEVERFLLYSVVPLLYFILLLLKGEHFLLTEIAGFGVLTLASSLSYYSVTGRPDNIMYLTTFIYFTSGVFKVRVYLKDSLHRFVMLLYISFALLFSMSSGVNLFIFSPLIENLLYALLLYRVRLSFIGWTEVAKGILFILLMAGLYG